MPGSAKFVPSIWVAGAGALGCFFASAFASCGYRTLLLTHSTSQAELINTEGIHIEGEWQSHVQGKNLLALPSTALGKDKNPAPPSFVLVLVKAMHTPELMQSLTPFIAQHTLLLTLQNGFGNAEAMAQFVRERNIASGVTYNAVLRQGPNRVRLNSLSDTILEQKGGEGVFPTAQVAEIFASCKLPCETSAEFQNLVWTKLLVNAGINPIAALTGLPNRTLAEDAACKARLASLVQEGANVAAKLGIKLPENPIDYVWNIAWQTGLNKASMLQDVEASRPTEIDSINGAIVRLGQKHGVPTPENDRIVREIKKLEG